MNCIVCHHGQTRPGTTTITFHRDGQTVVRRKPVYLNDATKEIEITIQDGAGERTITYLPASRTPRMVPQVRARAGCAR